LEFFNKFFILQFICIIIFLYGCNDLNKSAVHSTTGDDDVLITHLYVNCKKIDINIEDNSCNISIEPSDTDNDTYNISVRNKNNRSFNNEFKIVKDSNMEYYSIIDDIFNSKRNIAGDFDLSKSNILMYAYDNNNNKYFINNESAFDDLQRILLSLIKKM